MPILRLAYTTLFLIALLAVFESWSQVGGQSHLDLMPWYLKLVLGGGAAFSIVKAAAAAVSGERAWNRQTLRWAGILLAFLIGCGLASYYAHLYFEEEEQDEQNVSELRMPAALWDRTTKVPVTPGVADPLPADQAGAVQGVAQSSLPVGQRGVVKNLRESGARPAFPYGRVTDPKLRISNQFSAGAYGGPGSE